MLAIRPSPRRRPHGHLATTAIALSPVLVSLATMAVTGIVATLIARAMGRSRSETSATMLTSVHGNVGNFGIAIAAFAFGDQALPLAGIVMVTVNTAGILVGVAAATSRTSGPAVAVRTAFLAPMALARLVLPERTRDGQQRRHPAQGRLLRESRT